MPHITEHDLIMQIAERAFQLLNAHGVQRSKIDCVMDIDAVAERITLKTLLGFDDGNFMHDVAGIARHLNHATGEFENCFTPRSSIPI